MQKKPFVSRAQSTEIISNLLEEHGEHLSPAECLRLLSLHKSRLCESASDLPAWLPGAYQQRLGIQMLQHYVLQETYILNLIHQNIRIIIPAPDTIQITGTTFVIDDERYDAMPEAFFEHDQTAYTPVAIFVWTDTFEPHMEV